MKLDRSQLEQLLTVTGESRQGKDLRAVCPYCHEAEFNISLVIENHPFACSRKNKCGATGNIFTLLKFLGKTSEFVKVKDVGDELKSFEQKTEKEVDLSLSEVAPPIGWKRVYDDEYLRSRHFTDRQFKKFKVGRSVLKKDYVTVLVEMNGKVVGYLSRSVKSKAEIDKINDKRKLRGVKQKYLRYDNSVSDFARMLFGYDEIIAGVTEDVILVEGWLSKTKTDENLNLDDNDLMKCVATFGSKVSSEQLELLKLKGVKRIWLWFEADVIKSVKRVAYELSLHFDVFVSYITNGDPNDISPEEAVELLRNSFSPVDFDMNYI